ncbi:kin of IRRE-like protein 3 isoform X2 [Saccostrea cucullata]|uniref:kin of IRRE-like protein 3 isoform X2 n=1 Tax=Saccostrea cuccullata TaxID=36930 RepID=UPI002ED00D07
MYFYLLMYILCTTWTSAFSAPFTAYIESCVLHVTWSSSVVTCSTTISREINESLALTVSINNTRVNFTLDSESTFKAVSGDCDRDQTMPDDMAIRNISTVPELDEWPNITVVNISGSTELNCTARGAMKDVDTSWQKHGSGITLGNTASLLIVSASYADTGSYVCTIHYQSCGTNTTHNGRKNLTRTVHVDVQGAPLLILPDKRKLFHVAKGQSILFSITIASSPPPIQSLTIVKSNDGSQLQAGVDFNRTYKSFSKDIGISRETPVYSANIRLDNIRSNWTGDYILYINNSHGYTSYEFSIKVFRAEKGTFFRSRVAVQAIGDCDRWYRGTNTSGNSGGGHLHVPNQI